ncbi:MbtH family protein [Pseudoduganella violaceinigra]|uniref:MbtH family protein n=1 Tax=Pseudoduganella violaceinigra TaxID=246602 RepID=UPI000419E1BF|nr:MbtH family protein [Pseudoduganella violaceinigra]
MSNENTTNPFDDERHQFTVLRNSDGQYSLWPEFAPVPAGWLACHGPAQRSECVDYIERHWLAINPFAARA